MDSITVQYAGFIVAALILIWAIVEINRRYFRRRKMDPRTLNTWMHLDTGQPEASEESHPTSDDDTTDSSEQDMQARSRQNGHHSETKRAF